MASFDIVGFASWSSITAIFIIVTAVVYEKIRKRNDGKSHSS